MTLVDTIMTRPTRSTTAESRAVAPASDGSAEPPFDDFLSRADADRSRGSSDSHSQERPVGAPDASTGTATTETTDGAEPDEGEELVVDASSTEVGAIAASFPQAIHHRLDTDVGQQEVMDSDASVVAVDGGVADAMELPSDAGTSPTAKVAEAADAVLVAAGTDTGHKIADGATATPAVSGAAADDPTGDALSGGDAIVPVPASDEGLDAAAEADGPTAAPLEALEAVDISTSTRAESTTRNGGRPAVAPPATSGTEGAVDVVSTEQLAADPAVPAPTRHVDAGARLVEHMAAREVFDRIERHRNSLDGSIEMDIVTERFGGLRIEAIEGRDGVHLSLRGDGGADERALADLADELRQEFERNGVDLAGLDVGERGASNAEEEHTPSGRAEPTADSDGDVAATAAAPHEDRSRRLDLRL